MSSSESYKRALSNVVTENPDLPAVGFAKTDATAQNLAGATANKVIIKQNNTQIQLLTQIADKLESIDSSIKDIRNKVLEEASTSGTNLPEDLVAEITQKFESIQVTPAARKKEDKKGNLRVYRSPYDLLAEEKAKYGK